MKMWLFASAVCLLTASANVWGEVELLSVPETQRRHPRVATAVGEGFMTAYALSEFRVTEEMVPMHLMITRDGASFDEVLAEEDRGDTFLARAGGFLYAYGFSSSDCSSWPWTVGSGKLWKSADGSAWAPVALPPDMANKVPWYFFAHGDLLFVYAGTAGASPGYDGISNCACYGEAPTLYRSADGGLTWNELPTPPWKDTYYGLGPVADIEFRGRHYVIAGGDYHYIPGSSATAYMTTTGDTWTQTDIIPDSNERVVSMAEFGGWLYAVAQAGDWPSEPGLMGFAPSGETTLWRTADGIAWEPVSSTAPCPSLLVAGGGLLFAVRMGAWSDGSDAQGVYCSADGRQWDVWQDWPEGYDPNEGAEGCPLLVWGNSLYVSAVRYFTPPRPPIILRFPLSDFKTLAPGRITCSGSPFVEENQRILLTAPEGASHRWFKDGEELLSNAPRLVGTDSAQLIFDPVTLGDAGEYTCVYTIDGKAILETPPFLLEVLAADSVPAVGAIGLALATIGIAVATRRARQRKR